MFESIKSSAGIGLLSLSAAFGTTSCSGHATGAETKLPALGTCGDATVNVITHDGITLLVFDGYQANAVIQHDPKPENMSHPFEVTRVPGNVDAEVFLNHFQGESYVYVDGYKGGGVCKVEKK